MGAGVPLFALCREGVRGDMSSCTKSRRARSMVSCHLTDQGRGHVRWAAAVEAGDAIDL